MSLAECGQIMRYEMQRNKVLQRSDYVLALAVTSASRVSQRTDLADERAFAVAGPQLCKLPAQHAGLLQTNIEDKMFLL